jgi:cardiolipin synthase (CMP-forming)
LADFWNVPNLLTLSRVALTPFVILAIRDARHVEALVLFFVAAFTDYLDGAVARRFKISTPAGAYLDPIADKLLLAGVYFALAWTRIVPRWLVGIIFGRDLFILAGVGIVMLRTSLRRFPPTVWGKLSTLVQISTAIAWMLRNAWPIPFFTTGATVLLYLCVFFTVCSGLDYARRGIQIARART